MKSLIFVVDPMCSWSWGFLPVMESLRETYAESRQISLVLGGLRTAGDMVWDSGSKAYLRENWEAVARRSGQPFSPELLEKEAFVYDTYPACKAVVTVRRLWGDNASFAYLRAIQEAFYSRGEDITSVEVLAGYVTEQREAFWDFFHSSGAERLMQHDFSRARAMGATAFPSVVSIDEAGHMVCLKGYKEAEEIIRLI